MKVDEIILLFEYNAWADAKILAACERVSPEEYAAEPAIGTGRSSLRATMVHMLDNLWQWRITLEGYYAQPLENEAAYDATELHEEAIPTFEALRERWMVEEEALRKYLAGLTEERLNGMIRYVIPGAIKEYVVWLILVDALVIHATQHRSEAAVLLTRYGQSPGDYDLTMYLKAFTPPLR